MPQVIISSLKDVAELLKQEEALFKAKIKQAPSAPLSFPLLSIALPFE